MAMRLSRPTRLVDIGRIAELSFVRDDGANVTIGATTRQCVVERDPVIAARLPLLATVMPWVGYAATRARGTIGGSLANADPAAEVALAAVTLDATLIYRETDLSMEVAAADFFLGPMITALPPAACLTAVRFPVWQGAQIGVGFHEVSARRSDFAFVSAAAQIALDENGVCRRIAIAIGAVTDFPIRLAGVEQALVGTRIEGPVARDAIRAALADIDPLDDLHASAHYRRRVAAHLALRAVTDAREAAQARGVHVH
jgi:CO/xanthine dehydrogenase FAD-binding subunit